LRRIYDRIAVFKDYKTPRYYTAKEIKNDRGCSLGHISELANAGKIKRLNLGKYDADSVDSYFAKLDSFKGVKYIPIRGRDKVYNITDVLGQVKLAFKANEPIETVVWEFSFPTKLALIKYLNRNGYSITQIRKELK
jgi:hypothetical protein